VVKATYEIHHRVEGHDEETSHGGRTAAGFASVIAQIVALDVVFSLDSVITAVGMVDQVWVMIAAVMIAIALMMVLAGTISEFINRHPTVKTLALSFLLLIGGSLIADGFEFHIPKGYIYGPIAFSVFVEGLNLWAGARQARRARQASEVTRGEPVPAGREGR
jgi:predicted tellurium resistance membrane protein TerC